MNAENSHNAKTPSLNRLYLSGTPLAKPSSQPEANSVRREVVCCAPALSFSKLGGVQRGTRDGGFGLYFHIERRR